MNRTAMQKWTAAETNTLNRMIEDGAKWKAISAALGRSVSSIKGKIETILKQQVGTAGDVRHIEIPPHVLVEREHRVCAPPRDLTGWMLGDPPVGFSALERGVTRT